MNTIGDIALLQWYYSTILSASIFITESLTDLAKQRTVSHIAHKKIFDMINSEPRASLVKLENIEHGKSCLIVGENGCGKSTALYKYIYNTKYKSVSYFSGEKYPEKYEKSSGELQKHMVTRVASQDADVYIFDEPCSNTSNTDWIIPIFDDLKKSGKAFLVVSHSKINYPFDNIIGVDYEY